MLFRFFLLNLLVFSCSSSITANQKAKNLFLVTGSMMQTISYCGGAQPSQQVLDSCNKPRGIPYGKFFLKSGNTNLKGASIIQTINTDINGNFAIYLPTGNYCLVEEWKSKPFKLPLNDAKQTIDSTCFLNLYNTCDFKLAIPKKSIHHLIFIFHRNCYYNQPCTSYHGALRP